MLGIFSSFWKELQALQGKAWPTSTFQLRGGLFKLAN